MKKSFSFSITFFLLLPVFVNGQHNEIGIFYGKSYYLGDLNPSRQFAMARFSYGGMYRFNIDEHKSLRLSGFYGSVEADDAIIGYNKDRNLHFKSSIIEVSMQGEINFLPFESGNSNKKHTPYIFGGIGGFKFNPQARSDDGQWHDLQPLGTEGQFSDLYPQREPYSLYALSFLFGMGYKFNISKYFTGGLEWGMRRTTTDYLDDVSSTYPNPDDLSPLASEFSDRSLSGGDKTNMMRGNPDNNDWYSFAGFILTYNLPNWRERSCPYSPYD